MSQNISTASSNYQVIFDNALKAYKTKTGKDLKSDPLLRRLETCDSPDAVITLLQQQIPGFGQSGSSCDDRLTNWVIPVVNVLYNFAGTIGGAVSLTYPPAGVIFTGISSLLSAILALSANQSVFVDLFERIENFFIRLGTYVELPPTVEMTDIIVKVMVDVLLIFALVTKEIKQAKIKKFFKTLVGRSDMKDALQRFDALTQEEGRMAIAQSLKVTHGVGNDVRVTINKVDAVTAAVLDGGENVKAEIQQVARGVSDLAKDMSDEKRNQMRRDIEEWLSPVDPSINFNTANEAHHEGTAEWFSQSSVFKSWKESGSLLWIHGKPGSGKSVLSSTIIQNINEICNTGTGHLAFFFFDFKEAGKQDARALLSSLIVQLSYRSVGFFDVLLSFYSAHRDGKQQPGISSLTQCLVDMFKVPEESPIYLIIDAIDECPNTNGMPSSRDQVLALVERLVALKLPNLHLCVTSRPEADIRISLEPLTSTSNTISLHDENGQKKDIIKFVTSVVRTDKNMRRWREEDKVLVINSLSGRATGMFRWVFCQLETLRPCLPSSVRHILVELPETLDATYERILQEIPKTNRVHAHRLLQCLTAAECPLHVEELAEVLAIDFDGERGIPKLNEGFRWADQEQAVLSACSSLIAIVKYGNARVVQFSHFSVKEFLTSDRLATSESNALRYHHIDLESAHTIMARVCLSVIFRLDDSMDKETIQSYPLAEYAGRFFIDHAEVGNVLSQISDGVDSLFDQDHLHFKILFWLRKGDVYPKNLDFEFDPVSDSDDNDNDSSSERSSSDQSNSEQSNPERSFPKYLPRLPHLFYSFICGGSQLTRHLIQKRAYDMDASDMYGKTALHLAALTSQFEAMQMLIEHTADINARDNRGCTPLHYAMASNKEHPKGDHIRCVRLLLERGADPEAQNNRGTTPLQALLASLNMDREIAQILIKSVTNINLRDDKGQTALHKVSLGGNTNIISLVLNRGADVDAQDNAGSTPLHLAVSDSGPRDAEVVRLLVEHGANINLRNDQGQTGLHKASLSGDTDIIHLMLNHGADVNAQDNGGSSPLHLAISDKRLWRAGQMGGLLLKHGANINLQNGQGQTALHKAVLRGDEDIVLHLLIHGADVDVQDNDGSTPLHLIISKVSASEDFDSSVDSLSPDEVIRLLLEHGASGQRENARGETPFEVAEARGLLWPMQFRANERL